MARRWVCVCKSVCVRVTACLMFDVTNVQSPTASLLIKLQELLKIDTAAVVHISLLKENLQVLFKRHSGSVRCLTHDLRITKHLRNQVLEFG